MATINYADKKVEFKSKREVCNQCGKLGLPIKLPQGIGQASGLTFNIIHVIKTNDTHGSIGFEILAECPQINTGF